MVILSEKERKMPKKAKQKLKLIRVRDILLEESDENHPIPVKHIIERLAEYGIEAERKSIYEDIEELQAYGMDIVSLRGNGAGYYVASRDFEIAELKVLADAVQASKFISTRKSMELLSKIGSLAGKYDRAKLSRQVHIYDRVKSMNKTIYYTTDEIHNAISSNKKITFKYFMWNSKKEKVWRHEGKVYKVSPWLLIWNDENYYLAAYDSETRQLRHYRVDKMEQVTVTDEDREGEDIFKSSDISMYSTGIFDMFSGERENVVLECNESLAGAIIDRFGKDTFIRQTGGGKFRAHVTVHLSPRFYSWVMGFGQDMKIVSPW